MIFEHRVGRYKIVKIHRTSILCKMSKKALKHCLTEIEQYKCFAHERQINEIKMFFNICL